MMWDKKYAGRISIPPATWTMAMELIIVAARLAGGDERNPEPGFKKLKELKGQILTMGESAAQLAELFRTDTLDMGGLYSPMFLSTFLAKPQEYNIGATLDMKEGFYYDLQFMVIPKGHPGDTDVIHALVNYALDAKVQGKMAETVWYGPINQDTVLSEKAKKSPYLPSPQMVKDKGILVDSQYLATVRVDWIKRYQEIFSF
jgi:putative spermidine/putrescine transport system substrate-binding protein